MSQSRWSWLGTFTLLAVVGCSGPGGSGGGSSPGGNPQNKDEALAKLSPQHRANFENWKKTAVKSCDADEAFGLRHSGGSDDKGLDGAAILLGNGGSLVFTDSNRLAVLADSSSLLGIGNSKVNETDDLNGQAYSISAETKRDGSVCEVYLFGQKVYATYIAANFIVGAQYNAGKTASASSPLPLVRPLGTSGAFEAVQHGVFNLVSQTFLPSKDGVALVAAKLGLSDTQAAQFLKAGAGDDFIVRLSNSAVWTNPDVGNLIASADDLRGVFAGNQNSSVEVRLAVPVQTFGEVTNAADAGGVKAVVTFTTAKQGNGISYVTQSIQLAGTVVKDPNEAAQCAKDRASAYSGMTMLGSAIQPSVHVLFSPCKMLDQNVQKTSYQNGLLKSLIPLVFAGVVPSPQIQYGGWDDILGSLALDSLKAGKDLRTELDPGGNTKIVGVIADVLANIQTAYRQSKNLSGAEDDLYHMGLGWSFAGQKVASAKIAQIVSAVDNSIVPFKQSSLTLLRSLGSQPNGNDRLLSFAQNMDASYKGEGVRALNLSQDLGYTDFDRDVFSEVIQNQTSVDEFKDWSQKFTSIKGEISKYANIGPVKNSLVGLTLKWLKAGNATTQDLPYIYSSIDNAIVPFGESVQTLMSDLAKSLPEHKADVDFAKALSPDYKQLAMSIRDNSKAADYEDWGKAFFSSVLQKKPLLNQLKVWNDMWSAALAFTSREKARTGSEQGSANDWNRKTVIDTAIRETWTNADFVNLETIAVVARAKNTCDRYQGMSSLADCGGMSLFSKQKGKLLDPSYGGRYVKLANDFSGYMNSLSGFDLTTFRWDLVNAFFGDPIWSKCDQGAFQQKSQALKSDVTSLLGTSDQLKRWDLERDIKSVIENCE